MVSVGRVCQDYAAELSRPSLDESGWQDGDEENPLSLGSNGESCKFG